MKKEANIENMRLSINLTKTFQQVDRLWDLAATVCIQRLKEFANFLRTIFAKTVRGHLIWYIWPQMSEEAYINACHVSLIFVIWPYSINSYLLTPTKFQRDFPGGAVVKNLPVSAGAMGAVGLIPGLGRSLVEGNGNPLQYPCLENSTDRGAWRSTFLGVTKSLTQLSDWACMRVCMHIHTHSPCSRWCARYFK